MIWYPYQQMKTMQAPIKVEDAEGVLLHTDRGDLIDSTSSWWSTLHGYKHPVLNQAIIQQVEQFSHVMMGGLTHAPVEKLSKKLEEFLPHDLNYCFFSDSGSVGVEISLKMALQYNTNRGDRRKKILALEHAYHGDTFKAMEVGDDEDYHFAFEEKKDVIHIPTELSALEQAMAQHHEELCCVIVEPLLQGAGGMRMYSVVFLERLRILCDEYDILLIFDEVATGFGRTGVRFVSDLVCPDILVLGKALTGGYMGHAVTVANQKVYDGFYSEKEEHALMHGPTFMGNPLACSVALASLEVFEKENYMEKIQKISGIFAQFVEEMKALDCDAIADVRSMGAVFCIEVKDSGYLKGYQEFAIQQGVFSRPFLNYMYSMPPYIIEETELKQILNTMKLWFTR